MFRRLLAAVRPPKQSAAAVRSSEVFESNIHSETAANAQPGTETPANATSVSEAPAAKMPISEVPVSLRHIEINPASDIPDARQIPTVTGSTNERDEEQMASSTELVVPDIGDFKDIPVIEVFVKPGDTVAKDAPLITLESDKATLDVPVEVPGTIAEMKVKVGDRVSQGTVIAILHGAPTQATGNATVAMTDTNAPVAAGTDAPGSTGGGLSSGGGVQGANGVGQAANSGAQASGGTAASGAAQTQNIVVPDIGDFTDIPIIEIFIKPGDSITKDSPVMTLESDKATLDIPAPFDGVVKSLPVKVGDRVSAGTVIAVAETAGGAIAAQGNSGSASGATQAGAAASGSGASSGSGSGASSGGAATAMSVPSSYGAGGGSNTGAASNGAANGASNGSSANGVSANGASSNGNFNANVTTGPVHASPSIRRFARELGVNLSSVKGSGPNGRIRRDDVQGWVKRALSNPAAAPVSGGGVAGGGLSVLPWPKVDFAAFGPIERVPLSRIKKLSGPNLHRNWVMIPHVTQFDEADITDLEAMRKSINSEQQDVKVTMLAFMIVACVAALKKYPDVNSSLEGDDLIRKSYYNIGFAADTPNGLVVPVIRDADRKGVLEVAKETSALAKKARDGKLSGADMQGGTFTISSLGGIGGTAFTPIINAPEVAILGVSKSTTKPLWDGKAFQPRLMVPLSLSYDHRVIDGASAARFCASLAQTLADLRRALL